MKRWNFGGQKASHGTSKAHRSHGSTGSSQNPGRVFKGKKMAGRMGGKRVTVECLQVYKVDVKRGLLYLRGAVPGHAGAYVRVRDSLRKPHNPESPPPYPTYVPTAKDLEQAEAWAANAYDTPAEVRRRMGCARGRGGGGNGEWCGGGGVQMHAPACQPCVCSSWWLRLLED